MVSLIPLNIEKMFINLSLLVCRYYYSGPDSEPQVEIEETNGIYRVSFVPTEVGIFDVRVLWNRKELPG